MPLSSRSKEALVTRKPLFAMVVLSGAVTACVGSGAVVSPTNFYGAYTPTVLSYSATSGGILVEVVGNPFDAPKDELQQAVTGAMTGSHFGPPVDFVTTPPEDFRSPYRIVLVFDSAHGYTEQKLCREGRSLQPEQGDSVWAHAALCAADSPLTGLSGRVADVTGPDDPKFGRLISQMTTNLLPPFNPDRRGDNDQGIFL